MEKAIKDYLDGAGLRVSRETLKTTANQLKRFSKWLAENRTSLLDASEINVEAYLRQFNHNTPSYFNSMLHAIKQLYAKILPDNNPAKIFKPKPKPLRRLPRVPSQATLQKKIAALPEQSTELMQRNRLIIELAWGSGLRRSEIRALDVDDIDLINHTAYITGKGGETRMVPLTKVSVEVMRKYLTARKAFHGPVIVTRDNRRPCLAHIGKIVKESIGINTHRLRHAFATHLLQNGCGIVVIQQLLGHKEITTTQRYTYLSNSHIRRVLEQFHPRKDRK
jgi:site-specific recombinase XerD